MPQRHRRTERKKEAMMSVSPAGEDNYDAQRRAFHETAGNKKPEQDSQSESAKPVLGGRAERNRRQTKEPNEAIPAAEVPARVKSSRREDVTPEIIGTRGYQPDKNAAGKTEPRQQKPEAGKKQETSETLQPVNTQKQSAAPQDIKTTGPIAPQNARTTGPIAPQNARTTGPIVLQNARTTGPIVPQNARTTGPITPQNARTTGPIAPQNARTTGPIAPQNARTTGPITPQNARTTGPIAPQYAQRSAPVNASNAYPTGYPEAQGWRANGAAPGQMTWRADNQGINAGQSGAYVQKQRMTAGQDNVPYEGYRPTEGQNGYYPAAYPAQKPYYPNQEQGQGRVDNQPVQEQRQMENGFHPQEQQGRNRSQSAQKGKGLVQKILAGILAAAVLIVGGIFLTRYLKERADYRAMEEYVRSYDTLFVPGVYVDEIALEGMNMAQAQAMVQSNAQQRSSAWSVNLTYNGQVVRTITGSDLSMNVDVQDALAAAWNQGHIGTVEERKAAMDALQANAYHAYTANPSGDTSVIDSVLQEINRQVYREARDATIASFNPDLSYPFTFNEEVVGRSLNIEAAKQAIFSSLLQMTTSNVELQLDTQQPNVTVESIKSSLLELRGTATTPISSSSAEERNANIRTAFSKISGTIIQPGGQFSFNNIVGPRTEKNGFLPAIEYAYGELSDGIGGGVCQASTTVYLAAVRAGMEILKREPHSDAVSYIEYGKDATVYWYSNHKIDMVFKNTTTSPIYITAAVQSSPTRRTNLVCVVNIYGASLNGLSYDIVTQETVIEAPTEPEYVKDRNAEYVTYTDQQKVVRKASNGCSVDSWRVTYENGREVDRTFMYTDVYKPKAEKIYVGVTQRPQ